MNGVKKVHICLKHLCFLQKDASADIDLRNLLEDLPSFPAPSSMDYGEPPVVLWSPVPRPESSHYPPLPPLPPLPAGDEAGDREDEVLPPTNPPSPIYKQPAKEEEEEVPPVSTCTSKSQSCIHIDTGR